MSGLPDRVHRLVDWLQDVSFDLGREAGWPDGYETGWAAGFVAGYLWVPVTPGTYEWRLVEREAVREALDPSAPTLREAIRMHARERERAHLREVA